MMVIGLHSGKEFLVKNESFILYPEGGVVHVFTSVDGKRRISVNSMNIEYFDEVNTQAQEDNLKNLAAKPVEPESEGVDYV